jgi:hypothetical protein
MSVGMKKAKTSPPIDPLDVFDPAHWGLGLAVILDLGLRLYRFWERYRHVFASRTRDTSATTYLYLRAMLTLEHERNFKNMARRLDQGGDGQALQHFMSTSPWDKGAVFRQIQLVPIDLNMLLSQLVGDRRANHFGRNVFRWICHKIQRANLRLALDSCLGHRLVDQRTGLQQEVIRYLDHFDFLPLNVKIHLSHFTTEVDRPALGAVWPTSLGNA